MTFAIETRLSSAIETLLRETTDSGPDYSPGGPVDVSVSIFNSMAQSKTMMLDHLAAQVGDVCDASIYETAGGWLVRGHRKDYHPWQLAGLAEVQ